MSPAKGEGSSRRKGKEIASDDPATKNVSEDAPHFESERSDEEEGRHDLDSVCAPLIDPWCLPPLPSHVWLSIYCRNTKVS